MQLLDDRSALLIPLCKYTAVELIGVEHGRRRYRVLDGPRRGAVGSLSESNAAQYLGAMAPMGGRVQITVRYGKRDPAWYSKARDRAYNQQLANLRMDGLEAQVSLDSDIDRKFTPLPDGRYVVLVPDFPHAGSMTTYYRNVAPGLAFDQVWFPIDLGDRSRYIHVGNVSEGCVTVLDLKQWTTIHEMLVSHRGADGNSVADLTVAGAR
jgi:hypothetical protein